MIINMRYTKANSLNHPSQGVKPNNIVPTWRTNKIGELHTKESGFKKIVIVWKIPISTIGAIIKMLQSIKYVSNLPGRGHVSISS